MYKTNSTHIIGQNENYWNYLMFKSEERLHELMHNNKITLGTVFGDERKKQLETPEEAEFALTFILEHAAAEWEKSLAIVSVTNWIQAYNQIVKTDFYI